MSAETLIGNALNDVPKAVAAGVVDMGTGMLMAIKTVESHPQAVLDMLAAATREMFEGDMVVQIEETFKRARGEEGPGHYFQEIIITSRNLIHVFARLPENDSVVLVVVTRHEANLGLVLNKVRTAAEQGSV